LRLLEALAVGSGDVVSLVGGGGKTSLGLALVHEAAGAGLRAVFTTTTRVWPPDLATVFAGEPLPGVWPCCVAGALLSDGKLGGIEVDLVALLRDQADLVVVEADGSAGRPLKFPAGHEPAIPPCSTVVVPVAGAGVIGKPFAPEWVHRCSEARAFVGLTGCGGRAASGGGSAGGVVTPEAVARLLWHPEAATRGRPTGARVVPVINQADTYPEAARAAGHALQRAGAPLVLLAAARNAAPVLESLTREGA
jgi:molybdenum cofactor cytidylyltransferase